MNKNEEMDRKARGNTAWLMNIWTAPRARYIVILATNKSKDLWSLSSSESLIQPK